MGSRNGIWMINGIRTRNGIESWDRIRNRSRAKTWDGTRSGGEELHGVGWNGTTNWDMDGIGVWN